MTCRPRNRTAPATFRREALCDLWHAGCEPWDQPAVKKETFMTHRPLSVLFLVLVTSFALACASNSRDAGISMITGDADYSSSDSYDVKIVQAASPMSFPKADKGSIDVDFEITIKNRLTEPVTIDRISLQSIGGSLYRLETSSRKYE